MVLLQTKEKRIVNIGLFMRLLRSVNAIFDGMKYVIVLLLRGLLPPWQPMMHSDAANTPTKWPQLLDATLVVFLLLLLSLLLHKNCN